MAKAKEHSVREVLDDIWWEISGSVAELIYNLQAKLDEHPDLQIDISIYQDYDGPLGKAELYYYRPETPKEKAERTAVMRTRKIAQGKRDRAELHRLSKLYPNER